MGIRRKSAVSSSASGSSSLVPGAAGGRPAVSPYDNLSISQSLLDESYSIDLDFSTASGATSANTSRASSRCMDETASPPVQLRYNHFCSNIVTMFLYVILRLHTMLETTCEYL